MGAHRQSAYRDESGKVAGLIVFAVDITERLIAEAALREAHDNLERRVAERTRELATALTELRREMASVSEPRNASASTNPSSPTCNACAPSKE